MEAAAVAAGPSSLGNIDAAPASAAAAIAQHAPEQLPQEQQRPASQADSQQPQPTVLTPEQLVALSALGGQLGGQDLAANLASNELLQRLMVAPAEVTAGDQPAGLHIQLPRAPDLVSTSFTLDTAAAGGANGILATSTGLADAAGLPAAAEAAATAAQQQQPAADTMAAAVAAAAAVGQLASTGVPAELARGVKRKGDAGEAPPDSDVADILLAMAANPALKSLQLAGQLGQAAAAAAGAAAGAAADAGAVQGGSAATGNAAAGVAADGTSQPMAGLAALQDFTAGGVLDLTNLASLGNLGNLGNLGSVALAGGLPAGLAGLGAGGVLQIADLTRLPVASGGLAGGAPGLAMPGMGTLQLLQLPGLGALGDMGGALQQAGVDEQGRPAKRAKGADEGGQAGGDEAGGAAGDGAAGNPANGDQPGGDQVAQLGDLQQSGDVAAAAAAATALGTVVNMNGMNLLIPAAPQLQLQLTADANLQDQLLAMQQQVSLAQLPLVGGLGGISLPAGVTNLASASPEQMQQLQQQLQIQQQIQHLQLQQQLQIMQLQLSQQGLVLAPGGGRLGSVEADTGSHMVRRHGMLPERLVTRDMLKQVFHLPIEEAAKHLGIGQTMLKHYCRKFGIPRWPYRKRQSVVQLIGSIENYAADKPMIVEPALAKLRQFLVQIDEDPNIDLDGPIKRLRQAFFKEAYKARVRKQQSDPGDERGRGGRGGGRGEGWLENLCQAVVESEAPMPSHHHMHDHGMGMGDGDDMDDMAGDELAVAAAMHAAVAQHAGADQLNPNSLAAVSMAAAAQLAQLPGVGGEALALAGVDDPTLLAAAAAAAAQQQQQQADQLAALEAAAAVAAQQQQG